MLRKTGFILIAILATGSIGAQNGFKAPKNNLSSDFGIHAGPGMSILYNQRPMVNPRNPAKPALGAFSAGLTYQLNFNKMIALYTEANYERKGDVLYATTNLMPTGEGNIWQDNYAVNRINYFTVPVMARFTFGKSIRFFANAGMYAGFRISSLRIETNSGYINTNAETTTTTTSETITDLNAVTRTVDGGVVTGVGVAFPIAKILAFTFEVRNNLGLGQVGKTSDAFPVKVYNNTTNFLFGLAVNLNGASKALPLNTPGNSSSPE